jgi:hypothetical protein
VKHWDLEGDLFLRINEFWMRLRRSTLSKHSEWFSDVFAAIEEGRLMPDPKRPYMDGKIILVDVKNVQRCFHVPALGVNAIDFDLLLLLWIMPCTFQKPQCYYNFWIQVTSGSLYVIKLCVAYPVYYYPGVGWIQDDYEPDSIQ